MPIIPTNYAHIKAIVLTCQERPNKNEKAEYTILTYEESSGRISFNVKEDADLYPIRWTVETDDKLDIRKRCGAVRYGRDHVINCQIVAFML